MITANQLFFQRLKKEWRYQLKVWRTAIHWMVWVYVIIPYLFVGIYQYRLLWKGVSEYGYYLNHSIILLLLYFFSLIGDIRLFLFNGDQLVLRQKENWIKKLMSLGMMYSFLWNLFLLSFFFMLILPILVIYLKVSFLEVSFLYLFTYIFKVNVMFIKQWISIYLHGWKRYIVVWLSTGFGAILFLQTSTINTPVVMGTSFIIGSIMFIFFYRKRLSIRWSFIEDVIREQEIKLKLTQLFILSSSMIGGPEVSKVKRNKKKPFWFRKSNTIFKKRNQTNALIELYIKSIIRSKSRMVTLYQLTSIFSFEIVMLPLSLKWFFWLFSIYFFIDILLGMRKKIESNVFARILNVDFSSSLKAGIKGTFYIAFPFIAIFSFLTGWFSTSLWWTGFVLIGIGEGIGYFIIRARLRFNKSFISN